MDENQYREDEAHPFEDEAHHSEVEAQPLKDEAHHGEVEAHPLEDEAQAKMGSHLSKKEALIIQVAYLMLGSRS